MYKFIFELIKEPLGLPIAWYWEYLILLILNEIAYQIAWNASPGGIFGSEIHWAVRIPVFFILWAVVYAIIWLAKWLLTNWILVLCALGGFVVVAGIISIIILRHKKKTGVA